MATVATNWLLVIFIDPSIDITVTLKIWDAFLFEGNKVELRLLNFINSIEVLIRWCIAIFMYNEDKLLKCSDSSQVMQVLRTNKLLEPKVTKSKLKYTNLLQDFDRIQNFAYNRINPFSKKYVESVRRKMLCDL